MASLDEQRDLRFEGCALGISSRRALEHIQLGQINPFAPIKPASVMQPQAYVDIVDVSEPVQTLTGLTLADLLAGRCAGLQKKMSDQLLGHVAGAAARSWLASVAVHLQQFSVQRFQRNKPDPFLPVDSASSFGVRGLHGALAGWLKARGADKASASQWLGRINNLANKGLRVEEFDFSGLDEMLSDNSRVSVTGNALLQCLNFKTLRLSILPMVRTAGNQLRFNEVPANVAVKRIKPKLKAGLVTHPQWRDPVLGYWVDVVEWADLLGHKRGWIALTHRGQPINCRGKRSPLCATREAAWALANAHAQMVFPKLTAMGRWSHLRLTGGEQYREWLVTLPHYEQCFFSSHFAHRNVLLHVRCDIREDEDGERVLVLHEMQSDWAQQARRALKSDEPGAAAIPRPPWLQEWPALALKLMLLHAAERGATALAWTQGKVQVARYRGLGIAGLLELYDHTLPAAALRLLRPYGKHCESIEVFQPANFYIEPAEFGYEVWDEAGALLGATATWEEAQALLPDGALEVLTAMHGVRLDDELRQKLLTNGFYAWGEGIR